jgi:hypothetical protein
MVKFITILRDLLAKKCELSPGTTLGSILEMFRDQLGAFEVNGDAADASSQSPAMYSALTPKCTSMKRG